MPRWKAGLSPRVRGNPLALNDDIACEGSIPACAGEPNPIRGVARQLGVYPRVCGGTCRELNAAQEEEGLSPRVRGNQAGELQSGSDKGSIPACAGEPIPPAASLACCWVYPRVCGGTPSLGDRLLPFAGLSPRVRGNHLRQHVRLRHAGSIPACAGEPTPAAACWWGEGVYPRVCGGTASIASCSCCLMGLSPRVRGNHLFTRHCGRGKGSIPACAGEPEGWGCAWRRSRVYPRVCGGTSTARVRGSCVRGLSPRVRGNRDRHYPPMHYAGSIPACAGEPSACGACPFAGRVYPRVCGGTRRAMQAAMDAAGLSPRVRGNHIAHVGRVGILGSIPACAGEPRR